MKNLALYQGGHKFKIDDLIHLQASMKEVVAVICEGLIATQNGSGIVPGHAAVVVSGCIISYGQGPLSSTATMSSGWIYFEGELYHTTGIVTPINKTTLISFRIDEAVTPYVGYPDSPTGEVEYEQGGFHNVHIDKTFVFTTDGSGTINPGYSLANAILPPNPPAASQGQLEVRTPWVALANVLASIPVTNGSRLANVGYSTTETTVTLPDGVTSGFPVSHLKLKRGSVISQVVDSAMYGHGGGIDADKLDGKHKEDFFQRNVENRMNGNVGWATELEVEGLYNGSLAHTGFNPMLSIVKQVSFNWKGTTSNIDGFLSDSANNPISLFGPDVSPILAANVPRNLYLNGTFWVRFIGTDTYMHGLFGGTDLTENSFNHGGQRAIYRFNSDSGSIIPGWVTGTTEVANNPDSILITSEGYFKYHVANAVDLEFGFIGTVSALVYPVTP